MTDETKMAPEEIAALQKDIESAKAALKAQAEQEVAARAKAEGKQEAAQELESRAALEKLAAEKRQLEEALAAAQRRADEELTKVKSKLDEFASSRAVAPPSAQAPTPARPNVDAWSDETVNEVEENSARAFFGDQYDVVKAQTLRRN